MHLSVPFFTRESMHSDCSINHCIHSLIHSCISFCDSFCSIYWFWFLLLSAFPFVLYLLSFCLRLLVMWLFIHSPISSFTHSLMFVFTTNPCVSLGNTSHPLSSQRRLSSRLNDFPPMICLVIQVPGDLTSNLTSQLWSPTNLVQEDSRSYAIGYLNQYHLVWPKPL